MRVLAIKWRRLGDTALWTAALQALHDFVTTRGGEVAIAFPEIYAPLFAADPRFPRRFPLKQSARDQFGFLRAVRREKFDYALNFHASSRTARLTHWSGAREKLIHHHKRGACPPSRIPKVGQPMSAIERDLNVVRALGWQGESPKPRLFVDPAWTAWAKEKVRATRPLIVLGVAASRPSKLWPLSRYQTVASELSAEAEVVVVFDSERVLDRDPQALAWFKQQKMLVPTPRLEDLLGLLSLADLYIGSDSGIKHLACALGKRTVTLFGPESRGEWHGYAEPEHAALQKPVLCRHRDPEPAEFAWCGETICPFASHACMNLIIPSEVAEAARRLLASPKAPC